jgi:hypothetical protein
MDGFNGRLSFPLRLIQKLSSLMLALTSVKPRSAARPTWGRVVPRHVEARPRQPSAEVLKLVRADRGGPLEREEQRLISRRYVEANMNGVALYANGMHTNDHWKLATLRHRQQLRVQGEPDFVRRHRPLLTILGSRGV